MRLAADKRSMGNPGARTSSSWMPAVNQPPADELRAAAEVLNSGRKVAILVGQGALNARAEVTEVAGLIGAPVAKALLGKRCWRTTRRSRRAASAISEPRRRRGR
jgi:pyruvate dehydrogenase (quinone)